MAMKATTKREILDVLDNMKKEMARVETDSMGYDEKAEFMLLYQILDDTRNGYIYNPLSIEKTVIKTYRPNLYKVRKWDEKRCAWLYPINSWDTDQAIGEIVKDDITGLTFTTDEGCYVYMEGGDELNELLKKDTTLEAIEL